MRTFALAEVAKSLGVSQRTVEVWIAAGELLAVNVSRNRNSRKLRLRVRESDLELFLITRETRSQPPAQRRKIRRKDIPRYV